jgi:hypothetical protein
MAGRVTGLTNGVRIAVAILMKEHGVTQIPGRDMLECCGRCTVFRFDGGYE